MPNVCTNTIIIYEFSSIEDAPDETTLTTVPSNWTILRDSIMILKCETNASPEAEYHFYFNGESVGKSITGVLSVTVKKDGAYTCVPTNTVGTGDNATVTVTAVGKLLSM